MKIEKAIEIKTDYIEHLPLGVNEDWINADKLSIEALKFVRAERDYMEHINSKLLPGETRA